MQWNIRNMSFNYITHNPLKCIVTYKIVIAELVIVSLLLYVGYMNVVRKQTFIEKIVSILR